MSIWYAVWCKADGSVVADAFNSFDKAYDFYVSNPHKMSTSELGLCQWRGVFSQEAFAKNVLRIE